MRKLLLYFFSLIIFLSLADTIISHFGEYLYKQVKIGQSGGKINYYLSLSPTPQLLIMGDSRALRHINPSYFPITGYNIAHAGMDMSFQTSLLHILISHKKHPKYILLQIEPFDFIKRKSEPYNAPDDPQQLKYYYYEDTMVRRNIDQISKFEKYKFIFDSYRFNGRFINMFKNYYQTIRMQNFGNGFEALSATSDDSIHVLLTSKKEIDTSSVEFNYQQINYLKRIIEICQNSHIKLICFSSNLYTPFIDDVLYSNKIATVLFAYKIPYINYITQRDSNLCSPTLWQDAYHLNEKGAKIESLHLSEDVMKILKRDN
jgi:hypothetical protein